jgi:TM2 domain-containing membrane protein YozV
VGAPPDTRWAIAAGLAFAGAFNPLPVPLTGLHKFYLGQPIWGTVYLLLGWTQIPRIACVLEGLWYLTRYRDWQSFHKNPKPTPGVTISEQTQAFATAVRELEKLRQEGLISEHEFEQKRRLLLERL